MKITKRIFVQLTAGAVLAVGAVMAPIQAVAAEKLVIVTSYPPDTTVTVGRRSRRRPASRSRC